MGDEQGGEEIVFGVEQGVVKFSTNILSRKHHQSTARLHELRQTLGHRQG